jgi:hypothetical protein
MVLALVTVIMLLMLGAAYLQMARVDRRTAADVDTRSNVSDASILRYIGNILEGDIPTDAVGGTNEFFDYPYSNPATNRLVPDRYAPTTVPGPVPILANNDLPAREPRSYRDLDDAAGNLTGVGGEDDDTWLASTEPNLDTGSASYLYWPHVTDLSGVFLDLGDIAATNDLTLDPPTAAGRPLPAQYLSTAGGTITAPATVGNAKISGVHYAVPAASMAAVQTAGDLGIFADADGDGISDSRWTWAPLPSDGGQVFVMAVRIVDNSAMIDLNARDFLYSRIGSTDFPRAVFPSDLDLETSAGVLNANSSTGALDWTEVLTYRGLPASPEEDDRVYAWLNQHAPAMSDEDWQYLGNPAEVAANGYDVNTDPGATYQRFNPRIDEMELRWRNGLNRAVQDNSTYESPTPIEQLANSANFFRWDQLETAFDDTPYNTVDDFFRLEPRKRVTLLSGSAAHGQVSLSDGSEADLIGAFERDVAARPDLYDATGLPGGYDYVGPSWDQPEDYPAQLAAVVQDYRDTDLELTAVDVTGTGNTMYGMEYLPFISEVHVQARYGATLLAPPATNPLPVQWDVQAYDVSIEIVNPWPWEIRVPEVDLIVDGDNWGNLRDFLQDYATPGRTTMRGHELIVLHLPDAGNAYPHAATQTVLDLSPAVGVVWPDNPTVDDEPVDLELAAPVDGRAAKVVYQRFRVRNPTNVKNDTYDPTTVTPALSGTSDGFVQTHTRGTGDGLAALTVQETHLDLTTLDTTDDNDTDADGTDDDVEPNDPVTSPDLRFDEPVKRAGFDIDVVAPATAPRVVDAYSVSDWGAAVPSRPGTIIPGHEPFQIANTGRIFRTTELARMVFLGPRTVGGVDQTIAEVWAEHPTRDPAATPGDKADDLFSVSQLMLQPYTADGTFDADAAEQFSAFTSLPTDVSLQPGKINLNTAPEWMIASSLPLFTLAAGSPRFNIAADAVAARNDPASPGLAHLGELLDVNNYTGTFDGSTAGTIAARRDETYDYNEPEAELGPDPPSSTSPANHDADGFNYDAEERLALFSILNQVASTRSDVFTAYVLVRAYPGSDFAQNGDNDLDGIADPTFEYRLVAVYNRSSGKWRIEAVKRTEDAP